MKKRIIAGLLVLGILCSLCTGVIAADNPFTDVNQNDYCYEAVMWAYENGITEGTSATTFSPSATCTRAQVVTFLWRANGCPKPKTQNNPFVDVLAGTWYYEPVLWAVEEGITTGTSATTFSPDQTCTNAHIITFIWRSVDGEEVPDQLKINWGVGNTWYSSAAVWGYATGVLEEETPSYSLNDPCPRANVVTFLWRENQKWIDSPDEPDDSQDHVINVEATGIVLSQASVNMTVGDSISLTASISPGDATDKSVYWTSSDTSVATISNGIVTAKKSGSATITATTANGLTASCYISVEDDALSAYDYLVQLARTKGTLTDIGYLYIFDSSKSSYTHTYSLQYDETQGFLRIIYMMRKNGSSSGEITYIEIDSAMSKPYEFAYRFEFSDGDKFVAQGYLNPATFKDSTSNNISFSICTSGYSIMMDSLRDGCALSIYMAVNRLNNTVLIPAGYSLADIGFTSF